MSSVKDFSSSSPVALITGAGSGIGRAAALQFATAGCNVVAADIDKAASEETCSLMKGADVECLAVGCDITQPDQVAAMVSATRDKFGRLDYAFNNAGVSGTAAPVHAMPLEEFDRVLSVNLRGHFIAMQAQIPLMLATSPSPAIVVTSSVCGHQAHAGMSAYCASKFGVRGLVKAAAVEYGPRGLRVNSVSPGAIATPLLLNFLASGSGDTVKQLTEEGAKLDAPNSSRAAPVAAAAGPLSSSKTPNLSSTSLEKAPVPAAAAQEGSEEGGALKVPLRRVGQAEEIASCVVWLCMHGQYVTGTDVLVDGGSSCRVMTSSD
ncbi:hypothetical protein COO60DRAFT_1537947 [Scenedesmus sp. NREL 46B-D3]|nr:hypothetical protein COO60DRAFT_1537947 [Scenedesmus sp. NREL 46B-D3]